MLLSELSSTVIIAVPVGSFDLLIAEVSTPSFFMNLIISSPTRSSPTAPAKLTSPFILAIVIAWLAPLPPKLSFILFAKSVSPRDGKLFTYSEISLLMLPMTNIFFISLPLFFQQVLIRFFIEGYLHLIFLYFFYFRKDFIISLLV